MLEMSPAGDVKNLYEGSKKMGTSPSIEALSQMGEGLVPLAMMATGPVGYGLTKGAIKGGKKVLKELPYDLYHSPNSPETFKEWDVTRSPHGEFISFATDPGTTERFGLKGAKLSAVEGLKDYPEGARTLMGKARVEKFFDFDDEKSVEELYNHIATKKREAALEALNKVKNRATNRQYWEDQYSHIPDPDERNDIINKAMKVGQQQLKTWKEIGSPLDMVDNNLLMLKKKLRSGDWDTIEKNLPALKQLGYDSFSTYEGGKNIMLTDPNKQFIPRFDPEKKGKIGYKEGGLSSLNKYGVPPRKPKTPKQRGEEFGDMEFWMGIAEGLEGRDDPLADLGLRAFGGPPTVRITPRMTNKFGSYVRMRDNSSLPEKYLKRKERIGYENLPKNSNEMLFLNKAAGFDKPVEDSETIYHELRHRGDLSLGPGSVLPENVIRLLDLKYSKNPEELEETLAYLSEVGYSDALRKFKDTLNPKTGAWTQDTKDFLESFKAKNTPSYTGRREEQAREKLKEIAPPKAEYKESPEVWDKILNIFGFDK